MTRPMTTPASPRPSMPEHVIALRRAWEALPEAGPPRRINLPARRADLIGVVRLTRRFGRPPIDSEAETITCRLEAVEGLSCVRLNGREVARPKPGVAGMQFPIEAPAATRLVLELDLGSIPDGLKVEWGRVTLAIRPKRTDSTDP